MRKSEIKQIMKWTVDWCKKTGMDPRRELCSVFPSLRVYDNTTNVTIKGWLGDQYVNISIAV